jgi:ferric-dicitrate binding protein FerR (iron transport regulator)
VSNKSNKPSERRAWRTNEEWARLRERITASDPAAPVAPALGWRVRIVGAAAVAVLVIGAGVSWRTLKSRAVATAPIERVATTGVGERLTIRLADSSVVTLGPMSTVRYAGRSVTLEGVADCTTPRDRSACSPRTRS